MPKSFKAIKAAANKALALQTIGDLSNWMSRLNMPVEERTKLLLAAKSMTEDKTGQVNIDTANGVIIQMVPRRERDVTPSPAAPRVIEQK